MRTLLILGGLAVCVLLVTPSHGDRTEDGGGKMKTMDSESRRLAKRDAPQQVCCPFWGKKPENCKFCYGVPTPLRGNYDGNETAPDGEMKTMDSESRRLAKRDASKQVCCPRQVKERENCKPCSIRIGRRQRGTETAPDGEMKTMDSESRRLAKRDAPQQVCCPRQVKERENCKPCSVRIGRRQRSTETAPDGEMKTMDSESRRLAKRDVSKQVCCPRWGRTSKNCKRCRTPIGRGHHTTETTPDGEMKTMDYEFRRLAKRDAPQIVCCPHRGKQPKNCKRCRGRNSPLGRNFVGTTTTPDEEMKTMDSESQRLAKRDAPQQVCCPRRGKQPKNCTRCQGGNSLIGRNYVGTETAPDEEEAAQ